MEAAASAPLPAPRPSVQVDARGFRSGRVPWFQDPSSPHLFESGVSGMHTDKNGRVCVCVCLCFHFSSCILGQWLCLSSRLAYWRRKWEPRPSAEKAAICRAAAEQNILPRSKSGREEEPQQTSFTSWMLPLLLPMKSGRGGGGEEKGKVTGQSNKREIPPPCPRPQAHTQPSRTQLFAATIQLREEREGKGEKRSTRWLFSPNRIVFCCCSCF